MIYKIIWALLLVIIIGIGCKYIGLVADTGKSVVGKVQEINKVAENRIKVLNCIGNPGSIKFEEITVSNVAISSQLNSNSYQLKLDDSVSVVILHLGNPNGIDRLGGIDVYKYNGCNVLIQNNSVVGWIILG